jgi:preprotein translocase subunit SecG
VKVDALVALTRPLILLLLDGAVIALAIMQRPIPQELSTLALAANGFWFGARSAEKVLDRADRIRK